LGRKKSHLVAMHIYQTLGTALLGIV